VMASDILLQVLDTLAEINERHEAVKELEKSLMELHQIFLDMAVLVEAQGEMLDNIEQQVGFLPSIYQLPTCSLFCRRCQACDHCCTFSFPHVPLSSTGVAE